MPAGSGRTLFLYVADFGAMLHDAGWLDGLTKGYLHIEGRYDDSVAGSPLAGTLKMGPYRLEKVTPRPGIGTLNSAIEGLSRAGNALQFSRKAGHATGVSSTDRGRRAVIRRAVAGSIGVAV